jgi:hypothetical protein
MGEEKVSFRRNTARTIKTKYESQSLYEAHVVAKHEDIPSYDSWNSTAVILPGLVLTDVPIVAGIVGIMCLSI